MPFRHVVMFRWNDDVPADHVEQVHAGLSALPPVIEEIRSYVHGSDIGVSDGNYDYVVVADFDDEADFQAYRVHPDHQQLIADHITGKVAERAAVQFEYGSD